VRARDVRYGSGGAPAEPLASGPDLSDLTATTYDYTGKVGTGSDDFQGIAFSADGLQMICTRDTDDDIVQFDLSPAWDVSSMTYDGPPIDWGGLFQQPQDCDWSGDGTILVAIHSSGDKYYWATMSTPYDIQTSGAASSELIGEGVVIPGGITFNTDGTKMFIGIYLGASDHDMWEYTLSTPYIPSSRGVGTKVIDTITNQAFPGYGNIFSPDGLKFYCGDTIDAKIYQYNLSVAFDLTTAVFQSGETITVGAANIAGMHMRPDGTEIYSCHSTERKVITRWAPA